MAVNFHGVVNTVHTFLPALQRTPSSLVVSTGSKQGITTPPGTGAAYNLSKSSVRVFTEQLAHEMRSDAKNSDGSVAVHLLIPGWVHTGLTGAKSGKAKPDGAWTPEQTAEFALQKIRGGSFYILCPDNETSADVDKARMEVSGEASYTVCNVVTDLLLALTPRSGTSTTSSRIDRHFRDGTMSMQGNLPTS